MLLRNPRAYYSVHKVWPLAAAFIVISQLDILRYYFLIHFNIVSFTSTSSKCLHAVGLGPYVLLCITHFSVSAACPYHLILQDAISLLIFGE